VNNVNDSLQLFFRVWRRMKLWCGRNVLLTPISTWTRCGRTVPLVWNLWILPPMGRQNLWIWRLASWAAAAWASLEGCCLFHAWEAMVVIWTMIDDMRSWFGRAEFDPCGFFVVFWLCGGRGSIAAVSDEVLQWECMQLQSLWELQRNLWETTEIHGSWVFGVEAEQHVSSMLWQHQSAQASWAKMSPYVFGVYTVLILWGFRNKFYWMFCVWSSSIFDKAQWECEKVESLVRVLQVHYENGLCTPPS